MTYILQRGTEYCCLDSRNKIYKTQEIDLAEKFMDITKAYDLLYMARKKLKGFKVVDLNMDSETMEKSKMKRKSFSEAEKIAIYNKHKGRCTICGRFVPYDEFTIDHFIPLAKGGTNEAENLQCAHRWCNLVKGDMLMKVLTRKLRVIVLYQTKMRVENSIQRRLDEIIGQKYKRNAG